MRPQVILTIVSGELKGKQVIFDETTSYTIGRAKNCNLCFPDNDASSGISRYHCLLEITPPEIHIRDLGSTNGTIVNGQLIGQTEAPSNFLSDFPQHQASYKLKSGDEINLGDTILKVKVEHNNVQPATKSVVAPSTSPPSASEDTEKTVASSSDTSKSPKPSLKNLAIKGVSWTLIGYGTTQAIRFGANIILTRLLEPEIFGLMSLVTTLLTSIQLFSDFGINQSIIRHERGEEPVFLNTAWTVQVIRGFCIWLVYILAAWPVSLVYERPELMLLLPFAGLNAVILGFHSTIFPKLTRHVSTDKVTIINIAAYLIQIVITLILTVWSRTIWPLIIGSLASSLAKLFIGHWMNRKSPNRFSWDRDTLKELFTFGRWIFIATLISFLASQSDVMILGKIAPLAKVGIYNIAFALSDIPRQIINGLYSAVILPLVSKVIKMPKHIFKQKFTEKRRFLLIPSAVLIAILANFGDLLISSLYDSRYADARWMIPILSLGLWHTLLYRSTSSCLVAMGKPLYVAQGNLVRFIVVALGLPLVYSIHGLFGAVFLMSFSDIPVYILVSYGLWREKLSFLLDDLKMSLIFLAIAGVIFSLRIMLGLPHPLVEFFT